MSPQWRVSIEIKVAWLIGSVCLKQLDAESMMSGFDSFVLHSNEIVSLIEKSGPAQNKRIVSKLLEMQSIRFANNLIKTFDSKELRMTKNGFLTNEIDKFESPHLITELRTLKFGI